MSPARRPRSHARAEAWLWTGPLGHLVGGLLDLSGALIRYALARTRSARSRLALGAGATR